MDKELAIWFEKAMNLVHQVLVILHVLKPVCKKSETQGMTTTSRYIGSAVHADTYISMVSTKSLFLTTSRAPLSSATLH